MMYQTIFLGALIMLKLLSFLVAICLLPNVYAASLTVETPYMVRVEREMQARAFFTNDEGVRTDVTEDVRFSTSESYPQYGNGRFLVRLPTFGYGSTYSFTVYANYTDDSGASFSSQSRVQADLTPDYINISGPNYVASRSSAMFRATGYYNGRMADLTNRGSWFANYGRMSASGFYNAPQVIPGRGVLYDSIRFNFAGRYTSFSVYVQ